MTNRINPQELPGLVAELRAKAAVYSHSAPRRPTGELIGRAADTLESLAAENGRYQWQPIETVPKDAGLLLLWMPPGPFPRTGWFNEEDDTWVGYDSDGEWPIFPTHWMPLPEPPVARKALSGGSPG
jgi:hypothetical protein